MSLLTNLQLVKLGSFITNKTGTDYNFAKIIKEWLDNDENCCNINEYSEKYMSLYEDYMSLKLDHVLLTDKINRGESFVTNLDDIDYSKIPGWGRWITQDSDEMIKIHEVEPKLHDGDYDSDERNKVYCEVKPFKMRIPKVEIGQLWKLKTDESDAFLEVVAITQLNGTDYIVLKTNDLQFPSVKLNKFMKDYKRLS